MTKTIPEALEGLAKSWANELSGHMTCSEADDFAWLVEVLVGIKDANAFLDAHSQHDDKREGDAHVS